MTASMKSLSSTLLVLAAIAALPVVGRAQTPPTPTSPIQHVIVLFGENRSFDHVFGTFVPRAGQSVHNLLSEGIVNADGTPGKNFKKAHQYDALNLINYEINPSGKALYDILPPPLAGGSTSLLLPPERSAECCSSGSAH